MSKLIQSDTDLTSYSIFENDRYVGQIGLSQIYWPARNGRLGAMLCRSAWGRGIIQSRRLLIDKAFGEHDLHKIWLIVRADNEKGRHIWSRLGFRAKVSSETNTGSMIASTTWSDLGS